MDKEDILYNQTQNFGRTQFVRELVKKNEQIINLQQENEQLEKENKQLKENWNKLKEHYNKFRESIKFETWEILDEMQYIEKGDSNDTNR